jgi:hypothetical protein
MSDPWLAIGDPVDHPQAAPQNDPYAQVAEPVDQTADQPTDQPQPDLAQLNEHMRQMFHSGASTADILVFGKQHNIYPNPDEIEHARKNHLDVQFVQPEQPGVGQQLLDNTKNDVAGIVQGAAALPDLAAEGMGKVLSAVPNAISQALSAAGHPEAADWIQNNITHNLANPVQIGDAVEKVAPTPDTAAGHVNRFIGNLVGAAVGTPTTAIENAVTRAVGDAPKAIVIAAPKAAEAAPAAVEAAHAANDLGIDLPRFVVGSAKDAKKASALEQTAFGSKPISEATQTMLDQSEAARSKIAGDVGTAVEPAILGDTARQAAVDNVKSERARIGRIYDQARTASGGMIFTASQTEQTLQGLVDQENQVLGGTKAGGVFKNLLDDLRARGGKLTIDGARDTRSELRLRLRDEAGVTPDNADRLTNMIMGSVNKDIESGLIDSGHTGAIPLYRQADAQWAQQRTLEDDVLKPFLGRDFDNWGEDVAKKINADAKGNGTRLAKFLSALPEDEANNVRASLIQHLGTARDGSQNAAGDAFSLDTFLTNWNQLKGSRNLVFSKDSVQALDRLAKVAEVAKSAGRTRNFSNTAGALSGILHGLPTTVGVVGSALTSDPKEAALGLMVSGLTAARQFGAAKLLASPSFARKLASTPLNEVGAKAFWSRPWVDTMIVKNPTIAAEIAAFRKEILAHAGDSVLTPVAASTQPGEQDQQQQP